MKKHCINNLVWHTHKITRLHREQKHGHKAAVLWFTGLSGSGKSTIAGELEKVLYQFGVSTYLLDGDNIRHGLCRDLNFTELDRRENIRRVAEIVKLFLDAGIIVLTAFISPYRDQRQKVKDLLEEGQFIEIFMDTPLAICEMRDSKKLYKKARNGKIQNFTGIDSDYEAPYTPSIHLNGQEQIKDLIIKIVNLLKDQKII